MRKAKVRREGRKKKRRLGNERTHKVTITLHPITALEVLC